MVEMDGYDQLTVKASMGAWQTILIAIIAMDVKTADAIHALELTEAVEWYFACSGNEL